MTLSRIRLVLSAMAALAAVSLGLPTGGHAASDKVVFVTDFGFNGRHAYFFVAQEKGYYADEGLEVEFVRGQGSADAIKQVGAGTAQLGFADAGALVLARGNDGVPVKLISIVYAAPPHAIFALEDSGIKKPKDLEGRTVADTASSAVPVLFKVYAKAAGIDPAKVSWTVTQGSALPSILSTGRADAVGQFTVGEPLLAAAVAPRKLVRLAYSDAGLDYYGNGIIASEDLIEQNPDLVRRFVAATLRGMKDAFANPVEAGEIMHKVHRQVDPAVGQKETEFVRELATKPGGPLGKIDPARVAQTVDVVSGAFELKNPVRPEDLYADGFVTE